MGAKEAERLGRIVVARRVQLGMRTSSALAEAADLTVRVISDLESGRRSNFNHSTKAAIEQALKWHTGSIDLTLAGGQPRPIRGAGLLELIEGMEHQAASAGDESPVLQAGGGSGGRATIDSLNAITLRQIDVVTSLPLGMNDDDLTQIDRIKHEISSLPEVLDPWLDSPAGMVQYMHRVEKLVGTALDIVESYVRNVGTTPNVAQPDVVDSPDVSMPDAVRAEIPPDRFQAFIDAVTATASRIEAIREAANREAPITPSMLDAMLHAVDANVTTLRRVVEAMRAKAVDATQEQVDGTLPFFERSIRYGESISRFIGYAALAAGAEDLAECISRQQALDELSQFLRATHDAWVESGRSSKAPVFDLARARSRTPIGAPPDLEDLDVAASRREKQSDGERDDDE